MKTSNKILMSLFFTLILLSIGFMFLLKGNLVPSEWKEDITFIFGDIKELKADGNFDVKVLQYVGESRVKFSSNRSAGGRYLAEGKDFGRVELREENVESSPDLKTLAHVKMKECNRFELGGNIGLEVANPLVGDKIEFILKDDASSNISLEDIDTLNLTVLDNGNFKISGTVNYLNLVCKGNADIDATALEAVAAHVNIEDSSNVRLNVKDSVSGEITESSSLSFKNSPSTLNVEGLK